MLALIVNQFAACCACKITKDVKETKLNLQIVRRESCVWVEKFFDTNLAFSSDVNYWHSDTKRTMRVTFDVFQNLIFVQIFLQNLLALGSSYCLLVLTNTGDVLVICHTHCCSIYRPVIISLSLKFISECSMYLLVYKQCW